MAEAGGRYAAPFKRDVTPSDLGCRQLVGNKKPRTAGRPGQSLRSGCLGASAFIAGLGRGNSCIAARYGLGFLAAGWPMARCGAEQPSCQLVSNRASLG